VQTVRIVRGIPRTPGTAEQTLNRRASSARLRVVERIVDTPRRGSVG
jgi:16S rRNA C1402 N4-methylase RsmH